MARRKQRRFEDYSDAELRAMSVSELEKVTGIKQGKQRKDGNLQHQETLRIGGRTYVKTFYAKDLIDLRRRIDAWIEAQEAALHRGITWREAGDLLLREIAADSESWKNSVSHCVQEICDVVSSPYVSDMTQRELDDIFLRWADSGKYARDAMRRRQQVIVRMYEWARRRSGEDVKFRELLFTRLIPATVTPAKSRDLPPYDAIVTIVTEEDTFLLPRVLLYTGCRPGEAAALQRRDFDLATMTISISKAIWYEKSNIPRVKGTKTGETRIVPLLPILADVLADWLSSASPDDFLFGGREPLKKGYFFRGWHSYWIRHGAKSKLRVYRRPDGSARGNYRIVECPCSMYQLRHAYVSYVLSDAGISSKYSATIAGHTPEIQRTVYDHPVDASEAIARDAVRSYGDSFFRTMLENSK